LQERKDIGRENQELYQRKSKKLQEEWKDMERENQELCQKSEQIKQKFPKSSKV